jgi:hypothetical protein
LYETSQSKAERFQVSGVRCQAIQSEPQLATSSSALSSLRPFIKTIGYMHPTFHASA